MAKAVKYISIKQLTELSGKSERTFQIWCSKGKVEYRIVDGNGGARYEILVSSLNKKLQDLISSSNSAPGSNNKHTHSIALNPAAGLSLLSKADEKDLSPTMSKESLPVALTTEQEQALSLFGLNNIEELPRITPESEKKKALAKVDLIYALQEFRNSSKGNKTKSDKDFIELYNNGFIHKDILNKIGKVGLSTLYRYEKIYKESNRDFYALIPNYGFGSESRLQSSLTQIEKYLLLKYMLHQNCYALGRAYQLIGLELNSMGEVQHSYSAYRHVWQYVTRNYYAHVIYAREGLKACRDKALPYIQRDYSKIEFAQWIVGDGHTLDFMVQNPFNGKPCRASLVAFLDVATEDLVGYDIMLTENTQSIASALRNAIIYMGKKPEWVQLDNGKAFKSKFFTNGSAAIQSGVTASLTPSTAGLYEKLGIKTYFSKAYNGRAKIIERFFKEFTESYAKLWNTYIGNGISNKPAHTKRNEKKHVLLAGDYVPTIDEVKMSIDGWLNTYYRQCRCRKDKNFTIAEYVEQARGEGINIDELDDLMMAEEVRKIQRNGVKLFDTYYWNERLFGLNDNCVIKYSYFDLSYVKVYSLQGDYICRAERTTSVNALAKASDVPKDYEEFKFQARNLAKLEKNTINPMNKLLKQMYATAPQYTYKKLKPVVTTDTDYEITYIEDENLINIKKEEYEIDYSEFDYLIANGVNEAYC